MLATASYFSSVLPQFLQTRTLRSPRMLVTHAHRALHELHISITLLMEIALSCSAMPPLMLLLRIGAHVLLHHHHVLHQHLALVGHDAQHAAFLALVASGDHLHLIVAANIDDSSACS